MQLLGHLPVATPSPSLGVGTGREARSMSGCKGSYSLGVGEGLPACLSLSGCLSSKHVCCSCLLILF